jgi:peptidoglycan/LPS O-acetylase OafA/YrhL
MTIAERVGSRQNNFNALRLIAAVMVLVSHCFALTGHADPLASVSGPTLGELGVSIFFAISGFLIAKSWNDDPAPLRFAVKRALRLLPALVIAILLTTLVLGPAVSTLPPLSYLSRLEVYRYIAENSVLYTVNGRLPGVFVHNVYPAAVNGSLWTLPVESIAYVGAAVLGVLGALRGRVILVILSFLVFLMISTPLADVNAVRVSGPVGGNLGLVLYLGGLFNAGVLLYALRERVVLRWDIAATLTVLWVASFDTEWVRTTAIVAIPYVVLVLAYRTPRSVSVITRPGDLSYGIYVYAFPVQQLTAYAVGPPLGPGTMLALVAVPVYLLAFLSWRLIEAPALRLKPRVATTASPPPTVAPAVNRS